MSEASANRIEPIPDVVPVWEHEWSEYPEEIVVGFKNGHFARYQLYVEQPHPAFQKVINLLDKLPVYGGYKAPEIKKRRRR